MYLLYLCIVLHFLGLLLDIKIVIKWNLYFQSKLCIKCITFFPYIILSVFPDLSSKMGGD